MLKQTGYSREAPLLPAILRFSIPLNSGKGNAVAAVLRHYGFSKDEAIAFGDGHNDIEMLEAVGIGVAMGNAKDEVKAKADFVCQSVENDGIYHYCVENKLIF